MNPGTATPSPAPVALADVLAQGAGEPPADVLRRLARSGMDRLPWPGEGATLRRWQALGAVAAADLSLAKLFEGHTDALAILHEVAGPRGAPGGPPAAAGPVAGAGGSAALALWGVWAAEGPDGRVEVRRGADGQAVLRGTKHWCSGAEDLTHALLTAWWPGPPSPPSRPQLVAVALRQPGVSVSARSWQAVGMAGSASADVTFDDVPATLVGAPGDYLSRPGFWHGGAGVAACWYGGAMALGRALRQAVAQNGAAGQAFKEAALGKVDVALAGAAALLRETAQWIDAHPRADAQAPVLRARQAVEAVARHVLDEATRALGPAPLCRDAAFARRAADLPVFIRQSHAERDDAALGRLCAAAPEAPWAL